MDKHLSLPNGYHEYRPSPLLTPHIACYWSYSRQGSNSSRPRPIIPDGCVDILFDLSSELAPTQIVGTMTKPIFNTRPALIGVRFLPGQAYSFLQKPLHIFTDHLIDLSVCHQQIQAVEEHLYRAKNMAARINLLNDYFSSVIKPMNKKDEIIIKALIKHCSNGSETISTLSNEVGISRQHLARTCRTYSGISPKILSRIFRLDRAINYKKQQPYLDWAELAVHTGYYDQAHMINDFQKLTGTTPPNYLNL